MQTQEQAEHLAKLVQAIYDAVDEATKYADSTGLSFSLDIAYGMGGYYEPKGTLMENDDNWYPSDTEFTESGSSEVLRETGEWVASSQSC